MSLFNRLRKQLSTGGVRVTLNAPESVHLDAPSLDVTVTVTGGEQPQRIANIFVELAVVRTSRDHHHGHGPHHHPHQRTERYVLARVDSGPASVAAGGRDDYEVSLPLDELRTMVAGRDIKLGDSPLAAAAGSLLRLATAGQWHDQYELRAVAQMEGMRDPSDRRRVNIVGAGNQGRFGFQGQFGFRAG